MDVRDEATLMKAGVASADGVGQEAPGQWATVGLVLAGHLAVLGSFDTWAFCPNTACHSGDVGLMVLTPVSGAAFGLGWVTVLAGLVLVVVGFISTRGANQAPAVGLLGGALILLTTVGYFLSYHAFSEDLYYGPEMGLFIVALGGLIAIAAGRALRSDDASPVLTA